MPTEIPREFSSSRPTREVITSGDSRTTIERECSPIQGVRSAELLTVFDVMHPSVSPDNFAKADGAPLRVLTADAAKIDVSKRSREDMGFWHRSTDFTEVIICLRGALLWETEIGCHVLKAGEALVIPRGVAHRSALTDESEDENVLIEIKVTGDMNYAGPDAALIR